MPELRTLINDEPEWLTLDIGEDQIRVAYHPARVTPLWLSNMMVEDDPMVLSDALAGVISEWDVVDQGKPFPPTAENLGNLPLSFLVVLASAFGETATGSEEGKGSGGSTPGSPPASTTRSSTAPRRNGSATSPLPASIG